MVFRFRERPASRSGSSSPPSLTLLYVASGTNDDIFVRSYALSVTPEAVETPTGLLYRQDVKVEAHSASIYYVEVPYGPISKEAGTFSLSFDTTGGTIHISSSRSTVAKYAAVGNAPDNKQAIGLTKDGVEGCDIIEPALKLTVNFKHPQGVISLARIKTLALATGTVNSDNFLTFPAGTVLFLGASGDEGTNTETTITYQFACSENAKALTIGAIANIDKDGHDYLWINYKDVEDGGNPVKQPQFAYVERVYKRASLAGILGFGG